MSSENNRSVEYDAERPQLTKSLISQPKLFKVPPLTPALTQWVELIAPHMRLTGDEPSRAFFETAQNGCCWGEFDALDEILQGLRPPENVLDIGPGLGRSSVFICRRMNWDHTCFHFYEGNGSTTKYTLNGPRFNDSFCGNIELLEQVLEYNGLINRHIYNASDLDYKLSAIPQKFDLIYSFFSVGFHWSLAHFIGEIDQLLKPKGIGIFTVPDNFEAFDALNRFDYKIHAYRNVYPPGKMGKLLHLSR